MATSVWFMAQSWDRQRGPQKSPPPLNSLFAERHKQFASQPGKKTGTRLLRVENVFRIFCCVSVGQICSVLPRHGEKALWLVFNRYISLQMRLPTRFLSPPKVLDDLSQTLFLTLRAAETGIRMTSSYFDLSPRWFVSTNFLTVRLFGSNC